MLALLLHPSSYFGFFVFIAATGCGMPIPEEAAIVVAGVLSSQGSLHHRLALAACLAGAIVGDSFMYAIGYRWGHRIFTSHPRFAKLLADENQEQFQKAIESHSLKVMMLCSIPGRYPCAVYVMTGVVRMPYRRFLVYDLISATLVVGVVFWLAYMFGENVREWVRHAEFYATLAVLAVLFVVGGIFYYRYRQVVLHFVFGDETPAAEHQSAPPSRENP